MRRKTLIQALIGVVMLATVVLLQQSSAVAAPVGAAPVSAALANGPFMLQGYQAQKCVDDPNGSTANIKVIMYTCNTASTNQHWYFTNTDSTHYWISNGLSGKCLTVQNNSTAENEPIIQYTCNYGDNEEWEPKNPWKDMNTGWDYYELVNRHSGKCLTVKGGSTNNGATLLQYTCNNGYNQQWTWAYA